MAKHREAQKKSCNWRQLVYRLFFFSFFKDFFVFFKVFLGGNNTTSRKALWRCYSAGHKSSIKKNPFLSTAVWNKAEGAHYLKEEEEELGQVETTVSALQLRLSPNKKKVSWRYEIDTIRLERCWHRTLGGDMRLCVTLWENKEYHTLDNVDTPLAIVSKRWLSVLELPILSNKMNNE